MRLARTLTGLLERRARGAAGSPAPSSDGPTFGLRLELLADDDCPDCADEGTATPALGVAIIPPPAARLSRPEPEMLDRFRFAGA